MNKFSSTLKKQCHNEYFDNVDNFKLNSNCNNGINVQQLNILQINVRGMNDVNKFDNVLEFIGSLKSDVHILAISETFIQSQNSLVFNINNYSSIFSCRDDRTGGGLAVYIRNDIEYSVMKKDNGLYPFQFIQIKLSRFIGTKVCAIYRPPGSDVVSFFNCLENFLSGNRKTDNILVGDINIPVNKTENCVIDYMNLLMSHGLLVTNTNVTRSASGNILDHAVSSFLNIKNVFNSTIYSNISDHNFLYSNFCFASKHINKKLEIKTIKFDKVNVKFDNFLHSTSFNTSNPNICIEAIVTKYNKLLDQFTTIKNVEIKLKNTVCPWITYDIWQMIRKKNKILKKFKHNPNNISIKSELERISKQLNSKKYFAKKRYFKKMFNDLNQRDLWKNINLFLNKNHKSDQFDSVLFNGQHVKDPAVIVKLFNDYFVNVGNLLSGSINSDRDIHKFGTIHWNLNSMYFSSATHTEVYNIICSLNGCKGGGPDNIKNSLLKSRADFFSIFLSDIFNESLKSGIYPDCLKVAKVIPVLKNADSSLLNNYRPISTLSVFDKIFEKLIYIRLLNFLEYNNFFYSYQYGFRKGAGTELALIEISNMIYTAFDNKRYIGALFLDLHKAFDCINHELLLSKLYCYGVRGASYNLMKSYLLNRKQYVFINGVKSNTLDIKCGVPQGSVLGPLLFLIFINDIAYLPLKGHIRIFADDTALFYETSDPISILNNMEHDLDILFEFFKSNLISLNISKTKFMVFHSPYKSLGTLSPLKVNNITIERVFSMKYLGLTFDVHMLWQDHINTISNKIAPLVGLLRKLSFFVPSRVLLMIYFSFIHSRLSYGLVIYGTATATRLKKLQTLQNKSIKAVYRLPILFSTKDLYCYENNLVLPINILYKFQLSLYMYKTLNVSSALSNIKFHCTSHTYSTRNWNRINYHHIKSEFGRKSITFLGPYIYNQIPEDIKKSETIFKFKKFAKNYYNLNIEL